MLQSDRGTLHCCDQPCPLCAPNLPLPRRLPTDPDLTKSTLTLPEIRTRTGSLNEQLFRIPHVEITSADYSSFDGIFVNEIDSTLLSVRPCLEPYTPESIDSPSPYVEASSGSDVEISIEPKKKLNRDRSVSPTQLKNRLDKLLIVDKTIPELQRLNSRESCKSDGSSKGVCFALKCYGFCRRKARKVKRRCTFSCCTS